MINQQGMKAVRREAAKVLLRIAASFQTLEKSKWEAGPPRSLPSEHLKMETGNARDNLVYVPTSIDEVAETLEVHVGYRENAWYVPVWERRTDDKRRIGLAETLHEFVQSGVPGNVASSYH